MLSRDKLFSIFKAAGLNSAQDSTGLISVINILGKYR